MDKYQYKSSIIKPRQWGEIESFYQYWKNINPNFEEMVDLVGFIKNSELSEKLYGYTSLNNLGISIYNPIVPRKEVLFISFDASANLWNFEFQSEQFLKAEHLRSYEDNLIEHFNHYINLLKW
jgi:hypothetical protein